ncbi:MAG: CRISPR-associated helicase Cas3', partial [Ethanoligenens sp.]
MYYAHTKSDPESKEPLSPEHWQPLLAHLEQVAARAQKFGDAFGSGMFANLCGLFHDLGKYSDKFQRHLLQNGPRVDHSTAGAQELSRRFGTLGFLLAYCVAGHHAGLPDGGTKAATADDPTLCGRLKKKVEPYDGYTTELNLEKEIQELQLPLQPLEGAGFSLSFYIRMLYSCLVDSDYLDSEAAMNGAVERKIGEDIPALAVKLEEYIQRLGEPDNDINRKRTQILRDCMAHAEWEKGLYTLTVPTGGGKTISSLAFALEHAKRRGMRRVIYVIPYNSIIEQNAAVFKKILGEENVLEHHSNFNYDDSSEQLIRQRLATENWDMPVIVTTTVQFFESLFANRSSKCRKLHHLADSVIIFDEAQMLPLPYLKPCVRAIAELVYNYGCTSVLCSATQPALGEQFPKELLTRELCSGTGKLYSFFRRTELIQVGPLSDAELAKRLNMEKQVLCIVNTRAQAQALFLLLQKEGSFHLSTLMYPKHRSQVLDEIRQRLRNGKPCRVVATSLIEAGVDVDFPVVYRAQAGLDSQIQAAGRCNREGKRSISPVYI